MKIGVDISQIVYKGTGVARFTNGLVQSIFNYGKDHDWCLFFSAFRSQLDQDLLNKIDKNSNVNLVKFFIPPKALSVMWNNLHIFSIDSIIKDMDWFITSDWTEPPAKCKKATIVHDLVFKIYPETVHDGIRKTQQSRLNWIEAESNLIFTDSLSTEMDLQKYYKISKNRLITNYPGVEIPKFKKQSIEKYSKGKPFILTVGKLEPRKNIETLIRVFDELVQEKLIDSNMQLLIAGPEGWGNIKMKNASNIKFLGYITDKDLYSLYKEAKAFVYPSLYEGFGYPVIEAMLSKCPVVAGCSSSLQELGEDMKSILLFNPKDDLSLKNAIIKIIEDENLRQKLIKNGFEKGQDFSWKNYFNKFLSSIYDYRS